MHQIPNELLDQGRLDKNELLDQDSSAPCDPAVTGEDLRPTPTRAIILHMAAGQAVEVELAEGAALPVAEARPARPAHGCCGGHMLRWLHAAVVDVPMLVILYGRDPHSPMLASKFDALAKRAG